MKKIIALLLAALMLTACLTACGGSNSGTADNGGNNAQAGDNGGNTNNGSNANNGGDAGEADTESDLAYVKDKGTLVVGITNFEPMDYQNADGEWIGFDADMAKAFAESIGAKAEFIEINWDNKLFELESKAIDCVWNGMTLNDEVKASMSTSDPYCLNAQVLVVPADKAEDFKNLENLEGLNVAVESGSAGEDAAEALGATTVPVQSQANTLMEVSAGTSDAAVIDLLMAGAMIGEGTSYADLTYTMNLNEMQDLPSEEYGVGFRQGSDLTAAYNDFWAASLADGSAMETATTYGVQESIITD